MEILLNKKEFMDALNLGATFAGKSKSLPITECVKIKVKGDKMRIISTDMENFISYTSNMGSSVDSDVKLCINAKDLINYVKLVKDESLMLVIDDMNVVVKHKKGKSKFPIMDADEFPEIKNYGESTKVRVPSALLNNWIIDAKNFIANDQLRPQMESIFFYCKNNDFGCCGTDGHVLYWNHEKIESEDFEFKLNKNSFNAVCKLCSDCENIDIEVSEGSVKFNSEDACVLARQCENRYPNFMSVIPTNNNIEVEADRRDLIESISRCKLSSNPISPTAKIEVDGMNMNITCEDLDLNKKSTESVMVSSNGNITIGMNSDFILTLLNTVSTERVKLTFSDSSRAMVMREVEESNKLMLEMPVML